MPFILHRASGLFFSLNLVTPSPNSASTECPVSPYDVSVHGPSEKQHREPWFDRLGKTHTACVGACLRDVGHYPVLPMMFFWDRASHWPGVALVRLAWLVRKPLGTSSPHCSSSGLQCYDARLFVWVLGFELRSTGLQGKHFTGCVISSD